ncbi:virion structural protein [Pseudomonas phage 201phi2-1]|uniref:Virion structural protein n=1 Tax=Pseudomonas phage 201phi2-1 TaxID=198110 RepID=B3FJF8_BP201|nr:virion structural protein [Pseudomonas phage 201phi2-1]ABY63124.1 protein of unknown function [Pseudomonas phage 201phi2-1]
MAEISTSIQPGYYTTGQTLTVTFPANTRRAIVTRNERSPVLTEILAYDTGPITPVPPGDPAGPTIDRPFLAVTQDGRGNVIYDGGFPKFYNDQIAANNGGTYPAVNPNTFATLTPAQKYLYNGLNFCANPRKVAAGNRKVLFIGNSVKGYSFVLTDSHYQNQGGARADNGFRDTLDGICQAGNWTPTYYDLPDNSSKIDFTFDYLDQFATVVFFGLYATQSPSETHVTERFAKELAAYRTAGNGIAIITDHCNDNFTSVADALARGFVFGADATRLAKEYGCYFSGNVDRQPVLVSEIKRQIGYPGPPESHPLLNGLPDTAYIFAGASESLVMPELYTNEEVDPDQPLVVPMNTAGTYRVNVLVQLDDGTILTKPMLFQVIDPSVIILRDSLGRTVGSPQTTYKRGIDLSLFPGAGVTQTYSGEILKNGILQGYFRSLEGVTSYQPFTGAGCPLGAVSGDVITFKITDPFEYSISTTINVSAPETYYVNSGTLSEFIKSVRGHPYYTGISSIPTIKTDLQSFCDQFYHDAENLGSSPTSYTWKFMGKSRLAFVANSRLRPIRLKIYATTTEWMSNTPATGAKGDAVLVAATNDVYYWDDLPMVWVKHPQTANLLFNVGRHAFNTRDSTWWQIGASSTTRIP